MTEAVRRYPHLDAENEHQMSSHELIRARGLSESHRSLVPDRLVSDGLVLVVGVEMSERRVADIGGQL